MSISEHCPDCIDCTCAVDTNEINQRKAWASVSGRNISALLNPRPLALIGACDPEGHANFASVAWITPISHNPAMLAFALRERSYTLELFSRSGALSVCMLEATAEGAKLVKLCGNCSGYTQDKHSLVPHVMVSLENPLAICTPCTFDPSKLPRPEKTELRAPVALAAHSWITCTLNRIEEAGDHRLVIADVVQAGSRCASDEQGRIDASLTLLCVQHDQFAGAHPLP